MSVREQLDLLISAAREYDGGRKSHALHIATVLKTLFSDLRRGKRLIFRILSLTPRAIFLNSSCPRFERPPRLFIGLVNWLVPNGNGEAVPNLDGKVIPEGEYIKMANIVDCGPHPPSRRSTDKPR
jgi:hypothetical protein